MSEKRKTQLEEIGQEIADMRRQIEIEVAGGLTSKRLQELQSQLTTLFKRYSALHENSALTDP
jgi:flagellar biosynthesis chaperone FliJ